MPILQAFLAFAIRRRLFLSINQNLLLNLIWSLVTTTEHSVTSHFERYKTEQSYENENHNQLSEN